MLLLRFIQRLVRALNSDGTPGQVAAGIALGAAFGLTPLMNVHNLIIAAFAFLLNVSIPGVMLGWVLFVPLGFALDPAFDALGAKLLLETPALTPLWTSLYNAPAVPLTNFNNTVVLGSFLGWLLAALPIFFLARFGVARYRATIYARVQQSRFYQAVRASKLYTVYRWFQPE